MNTTQLEARRKGGAAVLAKYGREFYVAIGRRGGRPRSLTLEDMEQRRSQEFEETKIKEGGRPPGLNRLKRLWALRRRNLL